MTKSRSSARAGRTRQEEDDAAIQRVGWPMPFLVVNPGKSYSSKTTPRSLVE
jgi:hypothetical protein